jgi:hypothetical protein
MLDIPLPAVAAMVGCACNISPGRDLIWGKPMGTMTSGGEGAGSLDPLTALPGRVECSPVRFFGWQAPCADPPTQPLSPKPSAAKALEGCQPPAAEGA